MEIGRARQVSGEQGGNEIITILSVRFASVLRSINGKFFQFMRARRRGIRGELTTRIGR